MQQFIAIEEFKAQEISENLWEKITDLVNRAKKESDPQDPPDTLEGTKAYGLNFPESLRLKILVAKETGNENPVGLTYIWFCGGAFANITFVKMFVPLLSFQDDVFHAFAETIYKVGLASGRSFIVVDSTSTLTAMEAFLLHIGAEKKQEVKEVRLFIKDIDWNMISAWSHQVTDNFSIEIYHSPLPEDNIDEKIELVNLGINLMPHDNLELVVSTMTQERIRNKEESYHKSNGGAYTIFARHTSGEAVGYTEIIYGDMFPYNLQQGMTVVKPTFRGNGLGRLMKAQMLEHIRGRHPKLLWIATGNATTNVSMRKINEELGFRLYKTVNLWQMPVASLGAYLKK